MRQCFIRNSYKMADRGRRSMEFVDGVLPLMVLFVSHSKILKTRWKRKD